MVITHVVYWATVSFFFWVGFSLPQSLTLAVDVALPFISLTWRAKWPLWAMTAGAIQTTYLSWFWLGWPWVPLALVAFGVIGWVSRK